MGLKRLVSSSLRGIPEAWKAWLEFHFDRKHNPIIGSEAFNKQDHRQRIFLELMQNLPFRAIIETGTFRGSTTEYMAHNSKLPIYTVEFFERSFHYARLRLGNYRQVHQSKGDSRDFLRQLASDSTVPKENVFFYLDAHWGDDLPLLEEVELIFRHWRGSVIMVDDFEVPGDPGYTFDDYGPGKRLSLEYLEPLSRFNLTAFFPSVPSRDETGVKRGCVVLVDQSQLEKVDALTSLLKHNAVISGQPV